MSADVSTQPAPPEKKDEKKRRSPWLWVSLALAVIAVGLVAWGIKTNNDLDSANEDVADLQSQIDEGRENAGSFGAAAKEAVQGLAGKLGATSEDLAAAEQDVSDAQQRADQAQQDAEAAKAQAEKATDATDKAKAEADQAKAEVKAAESKTAVAKDCASAYASAIGTLFEGDDARAQAAAIGKQLESITSECQTALSGA